MSSPPKPSSPRVNDRQPRSSPPKDAPRGATTRRSRSSSPRRSRHKRDETQRSSSGRHSSSSRRGGHHYRDRSYSRSPSPGRERRRGPSLEREDRRSRSRSRSRSYREGRRRDRELDRDVERERGWDDRDRMRRYPDDPRMDYPPRRGGDHPPFRDERPPYYDGPHPPPRDPQFRPLSQACRRRDGDQIPGVSLLVRNISPDITASDLQVAFGRIGQVRDVYIPRDYHSQQQKGFAFVEFGNPDQARDAQEEMNRFLLKGRELEVVFAQERRKTPNEMRGRVVSGGERGGFERSSSFDRYKRGKGR